MSYVLVGGLTRNVTKHSNAPNENVPRLTYGQIEINLGAMYLSSTAPNRF